MSRLLPIGVLLMLVAVSAGCTSESASTSNFTLKPQAIGWYAGEEAAFVLELTTSLGRSSPAFTLDRNFALEELRFEEEGARFGGDYSTRKPGDVNLRLIVNGEEVDKVTLDLDNPRVEIRLNVPESLRDSSYILELRLFEVGWVKSTPFRVDLS